MLFEYDSKADAAYIKISDAEIADTREIADGIMFDYDGDGNIVGIEILNMKIGNTSKRKTKSKQVVLQD